MSRHVDVKEHAVLRAWRFRCQRPRDRNRCESEQATFQICGAKHPNIHRCVVERLPAGDTYMATSPMLFLHFPIFFY